MKARLSLIVLASFAFACGSRAESPGIAPSATQSSAATVSQSPAATASPTPRPNPTTGPGIYTNVALAYRVELPEGWRRSGCESSLEPQHLPAGEGFTSATLDDEVSSDIGPNNPGVRVTVEDNAAKQTALQWIESGRLGASVYTKSEKFTFDGRLDAARLTYSEGGVTLVTAIVVTARSQIFAISRTGPTTLAIMPSQASLLNSLHILSDVELSDAKATLASPAPVAAPARTAEETADALAKAFVAKDTAALIPITWQCVWQGNEQAGAATRPSPTYLSNLQRSFAAGLTVTAQARPIEPLANAPTTVQIRGTWKEAGQAQRSARFTLDKVGNAWYWRGVVLGP